MTRTLPLTCSPKPLLCCSAPVTLKTTRSSPIPRNPAQCMTRDPLQLYLKSEKSVTSGNLHIWETVLRPAPTFKFQYNFLLSFLLPASLIMVTCLDLLILVTIYVLNSLLPPSPTPSLMENVSCQHSFYLSSLVTPPALLLSSVHFIKKDDDLFSKIINGDIK